MPSENKSRPIGHSHIQSGLTIINTTNNSNKGTVFATVAYQGWIDQIHQDETDIIRRHFLFHHPCHKFCFLTWNCAVQEWDICVCATEQHFATATTGPVHHLMQQSYSYTQHTVNTVVLKSFSQIQNQWVFTTGNLSSCAEVSVA